LGSLAVLPLLLVDLLPLARYPERILVDLSQIPAEIARVDAVFTAGEQARHHSTSVRLARLFASEEAVRQRLHELAAEAARIMNEGDEVLRMHS
jgi:tRNA isopentenyl-2-thiomethyl-A-37 hydroxylase MiaE